MSAADTILAQARELAAHTGIESDVILSRWCEALARSQSAGYARAGFRGEAGGEYAGPAKRKQAHHETLLEGER